MAVEYAVSNSIFPVLPLVTVEASAEIPTKPSELVAVGAATVTPEVLIFALFITDEPALAIIPAVFLAVKLISPFAAVLVTVAFIAFIPADSSAFMLIISLLLTTSFSLSPTVLSALIPTDSLLSIFIVPSFDSVISGVAAALFPNIAADFLAVDSKVISPLFKAVLEVVAIALLTLSSVVWIDIPADSVPFTTIFEVVSLLVALESLAKIPADFSAFIVISFLLINPELFSPNMAAEALFSIVISPLFVAVDSFA